MRIIRSGWVAPNTQTTQCTCSTYKSFVVAVFLFGVLTDKSGCGRRDPFQKTVEREREIEPKKNKLRQWLHKKQTAFAVSKSHQHVLLSWGRHKVERFPELVDSAGTTQTHLSCVEKNSILWVKFEHLNAITCCRETTTFASLSNNTLRWLTCQHLRHNQCCAPNINSCVVACQSA